MKPATKTILNFALIFGTLALVLLIGVNGQEMSGAVEALRSIGPKWIALCIAAYLAFITFDSLSLYYFLRCQGQPITFRYAMFVTVLGAYYSNITPGATGGQPMQVYYLTKRRVPIGVGTSALTVKLFCFQFMLAVLGTVLWVANGPFIQQQVGSHMWMLIVGYVYNCFTVLMVVFMALNKRLVRFIIRQVIRLCTWLRLCKHPAATRQKWEEVLCNFHDSIMLLVRRPTNLIAQLLLAAGQLLSLMLVICFVYSAFRLQGVSSCQLIALGVMLYTSAAYTPLPGASGAQEGVFALYFAQVFPDGIRLMALLLWRFFTYYISLIVGAVITVGHGIQSARQRHLEKKA
ncbi:MAG: YbhN family protein [Aristaeellaceae bacterium]